MMKYIVKIFILLSIGGILSCKKQHLLVHKVVASSHKVDSNLPDEKKIDSFIKPYREHLNKTLDSVLCIAVKDLTKGDGGLESSLGNLMADICYEQVTPFFTKRYNKKVDFVLLNHGGLRAPILKGNVTARTAFQVMPFENELVVVALTSEKIKELVSYLVTSQSAHPISNIRLVIDRDKKKFDNLIINGKSLEKGRTYFVMTTDYLQQGGDRMNFFKDPIQLYKTDYKLRNAMIDYFKKIDTLNVSLDKRMSYVN